MSRTEISKSEVELSMPREKATGVSIPVAYRLAKLGKGFLGKERFLRFCLNTSWLFSRFSFELGGEIYGGDFHNNAKALREETLKTWIPEGGRVIDIGCGIGRWCEIASKYAGSVVGIDFDSNLIEEAKRNSQAGNVEYIVGDVTRDLGGRTFDLAMLTHVLEHIDDPDIILNQLRDITETILVEVPDFEHDPLNWLRLKQRCPFYSDGDHVREYTGAMVKDQLTRSGWHLLDLQKLGGAILAVATKDRANQ